MKRYRLGLVPGPVRIPEHIREAWSFDFGSSDLEPEFFDLYRQNQTLTQELLHTHNDIVITSGEAMSILWAALKCTLLPGEKMLAVSSGLFGSGFADMARSFGVQAQVCSFPYNDIPDPEIVRQHVRAFRPKVITAVHCETPSGTLLPASCLTELGEIANESGALFVVDFVSSAGGASLYVDDSRIDIGLLGSQKVLSLTSSLSISSISSRAWQVIQDVNYQGYEAYLGWREVPQTHFMPYSHDWHSMKALNISLNTIISEGVAKSWARHEEAAKLCREMGQEMGLRLYPVREEICSPTVSAFYVPEGWTWPELDCAFRDRGLTVGGNYGELAGKVFRIGHMGAQAKHELVEEAMLIISQILNTKH